jgi:hypothetical protein
MHRQRLARLLRGLGALLLVIGVIPAITQTALASDQIQQQQHGKGHAYGLQRQAAEQSPEDQAGSAQGATVQSEVQTHSASPDSVAAPGQGQERATSSTAGSAAAGQTTFVAQDSDGGKGNKGKGPEQRQNAGQGDKAGQGNKAGQGTGNASGAGEAAQPSKASGHNDQSPGSSGHHKITICHRTNSNTNPYVIITVDTDATHGGKDKGYGDHAAEHRGPVWNPSLKADHVEWGDIIPPFTDD